MTATTVAMLVGVLVGLCGGILITSIIVAARNEAMDDDPYREWTP